MKRYLKVVYFTFGLAVMIFFGSLNALLMTPKSIWFSSLTGMCVDGKIHSFCWLVVYILMAVHIGETIGEKTLRKYAFIPGGLILLSTAWCLVFFRLHSMAGAVALLCVSAVFAAMLFIIAAKETRHLILFSAPVLCWYVYLLFINIYLAIIN